ncbi:PMS1 protein homolog 1-like isoform X1 [Bombus pyrosoma]|uniref:PMS1 protein homolog 1-like isoform X1 n=1 Tax=Bombus pyrosoma TaxID=396416 RepID=UPI001CB88BB6|nr:PMS1 protein homolog 1-like isoform X1 [Bombus pyrosoma]
MIISALDKDTVKLITTTQVITSISTAVKELIENAFDAGAKNIEINLIDNGCTLIEVKDDGCGISKVDAPYMALSSYTSKLSSFSDLESLETYGFRGEALYALSAVSDLTIISKTEQDEAAISYTIDHNGHIINSEHCHRSTGTTVQVKQLFKQMPVRRQIITNLKKANQDIRTLESLIKSYGICKFNARINYKVNNNIIFAKPSISNLEEAVTYTLGKKITCCMNWIDITDTDIKIKIMVPSRMTQATEVLHSGGQYIFVNDRPIKYKELEKVVIKIIFEALGQESSTRKKPIFLVYILINAANIDVNLEPNKTSLLFKEQNVVINIIEKYLENFYGIQREMQPENNCESSFTDYQDYTQKVNINNTENEEPACKKRKLRLEGNFDKPIERNINTDENVINNLNSTEINNFEHKGRPQVSINMQICDDESAENEKKVDDLSIQLPSLDLSESDSNESQNFVLTYSNNDISHNSVDSNTKENTEDTPPFELSPSSETFSQLPIVDLGEDFVLFDSSNTNTDEKENKIKNAETNALHAENKLDMKKSIMLKEWSKGHVSELEGGTNVESYNYIKLKESPNIDSHTNLCAGFLKFSKYARSEDSNMTAPQIAYQITNLWKKLSPEERGYYRDLAHDEKSEHNKSKLETKEKCIVNINKNKNRLLKALEKMKTMNMEKKENLVMRTTVSWDIDLKKVTENFLDSPPCENTDVVVVGLLRKNLWIVYKSAHIWILDAENLKKKLHITDMNVNEDNAKNIEQLLQQWFSIKNDISLLHPIHSLTQIRDTL